MHVSNYFYNEPNILLADELCRRTGIDRAFFCNSGAEANEALLKLARHHFFGAGQKERMRVVAFHNAFHGRTLGALVDDRDAEVPRGLRPARAGHARRRTATLDAVEAGDGRATSRPSSSSRVQGEGGVAPARPPGFLAAAARDRATRTARCSSSTRCRPASGASGGSSAATARARSRTRSRWRRGSAAASRSARCSRREELAGALPPGTHGSTFGGNPLACAAALAVLRILDDEKLVEGARAKGEALGAMLGALVHELPEVARARAAKGCCAGSS